jgi:NAD(P)H-flavin reductase/ferredoxin
MMDTRNLLLNGKVYTCKTEETVLDALLRQNVDLPHQCRKQTCMSCLIRSLNGPPPPESQTNLKATLKTQNYFLACGCLPERDMELSLPQEALVGEALAKVIALKKLNSSVVELVLQCDIFIDYRGGQSVMVMNEDNIGKYCSVASSSTDRFSGRVLVHVERIEGGFFGEWVHGHLQVGEHVTLSGPTGQLFYLAGDSRQPIVLAGWNGGLSALIGITQDVFKTEHAGPVYLFHGVEDKDHLYLVDELKEIAARYPNFRYLPCVLAVPAPEGCQEGPVSEVLKRHLPDLTGWRVLISGTKEFAQTLRRHAYLAGAAMKDIVAEITTI